MTSLPPDVPETAELRDVREDFSRFAEGQSHLRLYSAICRGLADDPRAASLLLAAQPGQARPVLYLAALHDLVLRNPSVPAARWYPSVVGRDAVPAGDPWPDVRRTILEHADELRHTIATRRTQTNEVNRAVYLAAAFALAARDARATPVVLVELGASAGLLLQADRYRIELHRRGAGIVMGDPGSAVTCEGEDRSPTPLTCLTLPPVAARVGLDLAPVDIDDDDALRWLEACLWPDVPGRIERFRAAIELVRRDAPALRAGDMVDDLAPTIQSVLDRAGAAHGTDVHLIVFSSWALTYVKRSRRAEVAEVLARYAADLPAVSWVTAEPTAAVPGLPRPEGVALETDTTVLGARRWRQGRELPAEAWGVCHPHGEWIRLAGTAVSGIP
ncbi:MAG TPA: DUF2332 domain-containing protein [Intrasporangium sp.]|nr:DUF2332 domain-containing protein [Intrasporangium sp.]